MAGTPSLTPAFFAFLADLKAHNDREWFQANRERYEADVRDPFLGLLAALAPRLQAVAPEFHVDPRPVGGSMFRIHRDTRFSRDKSPYKTAVAAHIQHESGLPGLPGLYLHLAPGECAVGGGLWHPEAPILRLVRDAIVADPAGWEQVTRGALRQSACGFVGESLKRPPAGYDPAHPHVEDLKRKDFALSVALADRDVVGPGALDAVLERFGRTLPFVRFLQRAVGAGS